MLDGYQTGITYFSQKEIFYLFLISTKIIGNFVLFLGFPWPVISDLFFRDI